MLERNEKDKYFTYIKKWVDSHVREDGSVTKLKTDELDDMQPGVLLFNLYEQTGDERYKKHFIILFPY